MVNFCSPPLPFNVLEVLQMTFVAGCALASILVGVGSHGGRDGVSSHHFTVKRPFPGDLTWTRARLSWLLPV